MLFDRVRVRAATDRVLLLLLLLMLGHCRQYALQRTPLNRHRHPAALLSLDEYCLVGGVVERHFLCRQVHHIQHEVELRGNFRRQDIPIGDLCAR
uniref:Putative secreted protein n=1 Tax=Anopheles triannulatus TaxID=58253 RepID=A0A2M4B5D0_9DIPT